MTDYGHEPLFGTFLTPDAADPQGVVERARATERAGLDYATFQDHPYQAAFLDTWTLLNWVAAGTERLRVAPNVLSLPLRPPAVAARAAASLDLLSEGRLDLGVGAGAFWDGIAAMGGRKLAPGQAVDALGEAIDVMRGIWDADARGGVRVDGEHHTVLGAKRGPRPAHRIGVWVGAYKSRMLRLTARKADGWLPSMAYADQAALIEGNRVIDDAAAEAGRDPREVRRLLNINGAIGARSAGFLQGPPEQWVEQLLPYVLEHGFSAFFLATDAPGQIARFGEEVAPALRDAVARERGAAGTVVGGRTATALAARRGGIDYDAVPEALKDTAVEPGDGEYPRVRHNYMRPGAPGLVLRPATAAQVGEALLYAREQKAPLAVRSAGHGISGRSVGDGDVVVDLSALDGVEVLDRRARTVRVGAGARWGAVAERLARDGLAVSSGDHGGVGVGGLATTGGVGWMSRSQGLTIDRVRAIDAVLADGTQVRASREENPDLFWAMRGAGGNFAVATSFEIEAAEVGDIVFADFAVDGARTPDVLRRWGDAVEAAPREVTSFLMLLPGRGGQGPLARFQVAYAGDDVEAAKRALEPFLNVGRVLDQQAVLAPYPAILVAPHGPHTGGGGEPVMRSALVEHFTDESAGGLARVLSSGQTMAVQIRAVGGAVNDVAPEETAYAHRHQNFSVAALGALGHAPALDAAWEGFLPFTDGMYLSFETGSGPGLLERAFPGPVLERLRELKAVYDPDQVFDRNLPIPPATRTA